MKIWLLFDDLIVDFLSFVLVWNVANGFIVLWLVFVLLFIVVFFLW